MTSLFSIAISICSIVFLWKVFTKAGLEGWKAIIPIYNMYCICKIANRENYFLKSIIICLISGLSFTIFIVNLMICISDNTHNFNSAVGFSAINVVVTIIFLLLFLVMLVCSIYVNYKIYEGLAESFGKEKMFAIGLLLLNVIFYGILAFSDCKYVGSSSSYNTSVQ